jgi:hypothetical protein
VNGDGDREGADPVRDPKLPELERTIAVLTDSGRLRPIIHRYLGAARNGEQTH